MEKIRLNPYWPKMTDEYELRTDYEFVFAVPCDNCPIIDEAATLEELTEVINGHVCKEDEREEN